MTEDEIAAGAAAIIDVWTGNSDWRASMDEQGILESADWMMAITLAGAVLGTRKGPCETVEVGDDGWSEWIHPLPGYRMECCDCGLVHNMEFRVVSDDER